MTRRKRQLSIVHSALCIALAACGTAHAATSRLYVQDGLIACWDGIENAGVGVHDSSATVWKDLVAGREFALHGVTVNADRMTFAGAATSYGNLSATDTTATFVAATNGTLEIVYAASVSLSDSRVLLQSPGTSGFCFSVKPSQITGANASSGAKGKMFSFTSGTATNSASIRYDKGLPESALCNGASVSASGTDYWNVSGSETVIGTRAAKSGYHFPGSIYCIRLYNRKLTHAEIAANHLVDSKRFYFGDIVEATATAAKAIVIDSQEGEWAVISPVDIGYSPFWGGVTNEGAYVVIEKVEHAGMFNAATSTVTTCAADAEGAFSYSTGDGEPCVRFIHRVYDTGGTEIGMPLVRDVSFGVSSSPGEAAFVDSRTNSLLEAVAAKAPLKLTYSTAWATNAASVTISAVMLSGKGGTPVSTNSFFTAVADAEGRTSMRGVGTGFWRLLCSVEDDSGETLLEYLMEEFVKNGGFFLIVR